MTNNTDILTNDKPITDASPTTGASCLTLNNISTTNATATDHLTDNIFQSLDDDELNENNGNIGEVDICMLTWPTPPMTTTVLHCKHPPPPTCQLDIVAFTTQNTHRLQQHQCNNDRKPMPFKSHDYIHEIGP